jgi:hypothetical protein
MKWSFKMSMRLLSMIFASLLIVSCSSMPVKPSDPFAPYNSVASAQPYAAKKLYKLGRVNVDLYQVVVNHTFPDQDALSQLFIEKLNRQLVANNLLADGQSEALTLNLDVRYKRIFAGEAFGMNKGFGGSTFSYSADLLVNGASVATKNSAELRTQFGLVGNLMNLGKMMTQSATTQDEERQIDVYVNEIVSALPR